MATIDVAATASLSAAGNSTGRGTISWTPPALPADAERWTAITITGMWTWNGKGNVRTVTIGGVGTSADTQFSVDIGTGVAPPLSISCSGNKQASGNNFAWTGLTVHYSYVGKDALYFKRGGKQAVVEEVYRRVGGRYQLVPDLRSLDQNAIYEYRGGMS